MPVACGLERQEPKFTHIRAQGRFRRSDRSHEDFFSTAKTVFRTWSAWWIRVLLLIAHLALLVAAASLTQPNYAFQLGEVAGSVILLSTPLLWLLLWYARQRRTVLLFCGLVLAQTGLIAFVGIQFRAEDRVVREIEAEGEQRKSTWATQMANFRLERVFEMLTPEKEFHAEDLPGLLEQARSATVTDREQWDQMQAWASDAEKRLAAVNLSTAAEFRRGFESTRARNERVQALNREYSAELKNWSLCSLINTAPITLRRPAPSLTASKMRMLITK